MAQFKEEALIYHPNYTLFLRVQFKGLHKKLRLRFVKVCYIIFCGLNEINGLDYLA